MFSNLENAATGDHNPVASSQHSILLHNMLSVGSMAELTVAVTRVLVIRLCMDIIPDSHSQLQDPFLKAVHIHVAGWWLLPAA